MTQAVDLSILIVSWNVAGLLRQCLNTIANELDAVDALTTEIIVVDSASSDETCLMIQTDFPDVKLLAQTENVGFTRGSNIGLAAAKGQYLFLLNPDTEMIGNAISEMVNYLKNHPEVGIVGPHTLNSDGTTQSSRRRFPTRASAFFESTWLQPWMPKSMQDRFYVSDAPDDAVLDVDWVQGSAMMARRAVYEQIGGLDEGFVMYSEELDWCKRAKNAGWCVVYFGAAQIIHHGGKSSEQIGAQKHIFFQQSKLRYFQKYHGRGFAATLRLFLLLNYLWQLGIEAAKGLIGHKRALRQARVKTYWQVLRSGLRVG